MSKEYLFNELGNILSNLRGLRRNINNLNVNRISRNEIREQTRTCAQMWFENIIPYINRYDISSEILKKYNALFRELIKISLVKTRKNKYLKTIDEITQNINDELFTTLLTSNNSIVNIDSIQQILENASSLEKDYLEEAIGCAQNNFLRASIVLAWNSAAYRMRKIVELNGFEKFNQDSEILTKRKDRRYRGFDRKYQISSYNELNRIVPDNHLLLMLEYWGIIDSNQCDRLFTCYTVRCNSAHPGQARISRQNLASFYSDLKMMIFDNPTCRI